MSRWVEVNTPLTYAVMVVMGGEIRHCLHDHIRLLGHRCIHSAFKERIKVPGKHLMKTTLNLVQKLDVILCD